MTFVSFKIIRTSLLCCSLLLLIRCDSETERSAKPYQEYSTAPTQHYPTESLPVVKKSSPPVYSPSKKNKTITKKSNRSASSLSTGNEETITWKQVNSQPTPRQQVTKKEASYSIRTGAICCDGSRSYATGRGACSHHGGVCEWLYQ